MPLFPDHLTHRAKNTLRTASALAHSLHAHTVTPLHVLAAIVREDGSAGAHVLQSVGITSAVIARHIVTTPPTPRKKTSAPRVSKNLKNVLVHAFTVAGRSGMSYVGTEHLAYAIMETRDASVADILSDPAILQRIQAALTDLTATGPATLPHMTQLLNPDHESDEDSVLSQEESALTHFCTDMTARTTAPKPIIGRDAIVAHMIATLSRREKSNPLLIGEPGVGKTAIVEGLAARIADGTVPAHLLSARILSLDLASLVAGTTFRGEFEARIKDVIAEAQEDPSVILFIDEVHMLIGAGGTQGSLDAANILKPALGRGTMRVIGATTLAEYRKQIEKDAALGRRFQPITVPEPTQEEAITIVSGARTFYEAFHHVQIPHDIIAQTVAWSIRFLPERHLPDKAFDILDEAAARVRIANADPRERTRILLEREHMTITHKKARAIHEGRYTDALALRAKEHTVAEKVAVLTKPQTHKKPHTLTKEDVATAIATLAQIPKSRITATPSATVHDALARWRTRIIGQDAVVAAVSHTILRSVSGFRSEQRPLGSFLFLGQTGTGKTYAAQTLAQELFDRADALIRIDMSELMEKHAIAKLIGAPAGYVGYGEAPTLVERVRRQPASVVLFDEIEKAHPDTLHILLQILEDGVLTDAAGVRADFRNTIVILTSNSGTGSSMQSSTIRFDADPTDPQKNQDNERILSHVRASIAPEILNRLDHVLVFTAFGDTERYALAQQACTDLTKTFTAQTGIALRITPRVISHIAAEAAKKPLAGARAIRHACRAAIEDPVADFLGKAHIRPTKILCDCAADGKPLLRNMPARHRTHA